MRVKKYVANTMPEAMNLIRKELGSEAVILNSKEVQRNGFFGFFKKKKIEVYAALDKDPLKEEKVIKQKKQDINNQLKIPELMNSEESNQSILKEINYLKQLIEKQSNDKESDFPPSYQLMY